MLKIVVFYLAKPLAERLETSQIHDSMIFFTFFNNFRRCLYPCDDQISQKAANSPLYWVSYKTEKQEWMLWERERGGG